MYPKKPCDQGFLSFFFLSVYYLPPVDWWGSERWRQADPYLRKLFYVYRKKVVDKRKEQWYTAARS